MIINHISSNLRIDIINCMMHHYFMYIQKKLPKYHMPSIIRHILISAMLKRTSQHQ